jgi:hypothetical protein
MKRIDDYNLLVPLKNRIALKHRERINAQKNILKLKMEYDGQGDIKQPCLYVVGLGEKHAKQFSDEIISLCNNYPWTKDRYVPYLIYRHIKNSQQAMLKDAVNNIVLKKKFPAFFYVVININHKIFSLIIEEFGENFTSYDRLIKNYANNSNNGFPGDELGLYDEKTETKSTGFGGDSNIKTKLILTEDDRLVIIDSINDYINKTYLRVPDKDVLNEYFIYSLYKKNKYLWKRIFFRFENDTE